MRILKAEFTHSVFQAQHLPPPVFPEIAFAGRSNVGKSSLINTLLGRKGLAKTSSVPGKTRSINVYLINDRIRFVDLPGYGYARVPLAVRRSWQGLVESYLQSRKGRLRLVVVILDIRRTPSDGDSRLLEWLDHHSLRTCVVATKVDKESKPHLRDRLNSIQERLGTKPIPFSSRTGEGRVELWRLIDRAIADPLLPLQESSKIFS